MRHKHFPVFHCPKLCHFPKFLIVTFFAFVFHVVTLAILLMRPIDQLCFQISNCNVFVYVTLAYVFDVSIVTFEL